MTMKRLAVLPLIAVIGIIGMLVIPISPVLLDFLLVLNMSIAITVLLVAMTTKEPLNFSVFPSLLLITTLFRLALNVSSTRLILTQGYAGQVIETFGNFVIGGNPVVGVIVYVILAIIQFIVITRGGERAAEVAARFTLDAMPGKQISIDADLNAGVITEIQAREKREAIEREADFYGAMDGASKFVKGDATASMIIVAVNIIGGFIIGMVQQGDSFSTAISTYTVLSVGDGLVSQIPALLLSTAAGLTVTRSAAKQDFGTELITQLTAYPRMLYIVAVVILILGLLSPIGPLPTVPLSILLVVAGRRMIRARSLEEGDAKKKAEQERSKTVKSPESMYSLIQVDPIEFEFGYGLIPLADVAQGGDLLERVALIRRQVALDLGIVVPMIRFRDNIQLRPNEYTIRIRGNEVARYELMPNHYLAMSPGMSDPSVVGIPTKEPAFGLPAEWINEAMRDRAILANYTVVDPPSMIATHMTEVIKRHASELLGRQETRALLDALKEQHPVLVEELVPQLLSVGEVQKVLANLLQERVSIRDLSSILEALSDHARLIKDMDLLTEFARQRLSRQITYQARAGAGAVTAITLSAGAERRIQEFIGHTDQGAQLTMDPRLAQQLTKSIGEHTNRLATLGKSAVLLVSPVLRGHIRKLMQRSLPDLSVLSYAELDPEAPVESGGVVNL
ncbi:MAG: flagellar biosynthesis protein FlhA [Firmicutes bacterium]|nr:flagellar biosynthesis protein FlhA [Bacillota bacterium]